MATSGHTSQVLSTKQKTAVCISNKNKLFISVKDSDISTRNSLIIAASEKRPEEEDACQKLLTDFAGSQSLSSAVYNIAETLRNNIKIRFEGKV